MSAPPRWSSPSGGSRRTTSSKDSRSRRPSLLIAAGGVEEWLATHVEEAGRPRQRRAVHRDPGEAEGGPSHREQPGLVEPYATSTGIEKRAVPAERIAIPASADAGERWPPRWMLCDAACGFTIETTFPAARNQGASPAWSASAPASAQRGGAPATAIPAAALARKSTSEKAYAAAFFATSTSFRSIGARNHARAPPRSQPNALSQNGWVARWA